MHCHIIIIIKISMTIKNGNVSNKRIFAIAALGGVRAL